MDGEAIWTGERKRENRVCFSWVQYVTIKHLWIRWTKRHLEWEKPNVWIQLYNVLPRPGKMMMMMMMMMMIERTVNNIITKISFRCGRQAHRLYNSFTKYIFVISSENVRQANEGDSDHGNGRCNSDQNQVTTTLRWNIMFQLDIYFWYLHRNLDMN